MNRRFIQSARIDWERIPQDSYLRRIGALLRMGEMRFGADVTFLVGENGSGKSTLVEGIAVAYGFNPEGGNFNYRFSTYDDVSQLGQAIKLSKGYRRPRAGYFFRAESFFNVASKAEEYRDGDSKEAFYARYGGRSLHEQSHGESFLAYFLSFDQPGLYIMDEPEAALSPQRQLTLLCQIHALARAGAQFIISTHSPILLGLPGADILCMDDGAMRSCRYEETGSYQVTKMFLDNREGILKRLLEEQ